MPEYNIFGENDKMVKGYKGFLFHASLLFLDENYNIFMSVFV